MKVRIWSMAVAATLLACSAEAMAQRPPGGGGQGKPSFDLLLNAFDANRDSALARIEVPVRLWPRIVKADANKDGYVTRAEYDAYKP